MPIYVKSSYQLINVFKEKFNQSIPRLFCTDIDGVLTISRRSYVLDLDVIEALRKLKELGVNVCLASATAYPTVKCLIRYLGLSPIAIAEDGCIVEVYGKLLHVTSKSGREAVKEIAKIFGLKESWQNSYRHHDFALELIESDDRRRVSHELLARIRSIISKKFPWLKIVYTGFAIHIHPAECDKGSALRIISEELSLKPSEIIAIGDSIVDSGMLRFAGLGIAVGDADEEAKRAADIVVGLPSSKASLLVLTTLINYITDNSNIAKQ